ncbi:hypothetical protein XA68_14649 [Ophiocordyceps unilateralis]|uniref:Protein kinase domain-containing protein n=1 Tax=Ophiocordyceps unilateralis TaxID=268505 RepID=A0A2A9P9N4_OPHUN|nr:hypothetical protein XA68_14649 [Ophiocordyceps unilateralis]
MEAGLYVQLAYRSACLCVNAFRNSLNYPQDAERLVLKLEMERFRLHIWGENSGLTPPGGGPPSLSSRLLSISDVLARYLEGIGCLLKDADVLRDRYGLAETRAQPTGSTRVKDLLEKMQKSIPSGEVRVEEAIGNLDVEQNKKKKKKKKKSASSASSLFRWAVRDLDKFDGLVDDLASRITQISQLLTESQQLKAQEDNERVSIVLVDSVADKPTLDFLLAAVKTEPKTSSTRFRIESKAISTELPWSWPHVRYPSSSSLQPRLSDFLLPDAYSSRKRFLTRRKRGSESGVVYLFECKQFEANISHDDKERLVGRLQLLVMLLSKPKTAAFHTPVAEGCINDASSFCWWMVFRLSVPPLPVSTGPQLTSLEPLSLLSLLQPKAKFRPCLEERYKLASRLCTTLFELYSSSWLHKGIRSENVLFVSYQPMSAGILESMVLCGFDYSRQESERVTIDKSKTSSDVSAAMYRHPRYQGEAAEGYKIQYDIYSLGLVLVEMALWMPLSSFLEGKPIAGHQKSGAGSDAAKLCPDMAIFHEPHAALLKKRVMSRVESEFRFRVGTSYYEATKFCLDFADQKLAADEDSLAAHPSLEFYNAVVVPLSRLARAHSSA